MYLGQCALCSLPPPVPPVPLASLSILSCLPPYLQPLTSSFFTLQVTFEWVWRGDSMTLTAITEILEKSLSHYHFVHPKSYTNSPETEPRSLHLFIALADTQGVQTLGLVRGSAQLTVLV